MHLFSILAGKMIVAGKWPLVSKYGWHIQSVSQRVICISLYRILFQMWRPLQRSHPDSVNWAWKHGRFPRIISEGYTCCTLLIFHKLKVSILKNYTKVFFSWNSGRIFRCLLKYGGRNSRSRSTTRPLIFKLSIAQKLYTKISTCNERWYYDEYLLKVWSPPDDHRIFCDFLKNTYFGR